MTLLWAPVTLAASGFQVARNALQRGLMPSTGPWGATLVRFLFGLPFSVLFVGLAFGFTPGVRPQFTSEFWTAAMSGALAQVLATATLLVAMERAGFAVGTALQQSSLPLSAVLGLVLFHDALSPLSWLGVAITSVGLVVLTWPSQGTSGERPISGAAFGLLSGLTFGFSLNAFRHAGLALEPRHPVFSALASVAVVQAAQALVLTVLLALWDRRALGAVIVGWRPSLAAGLCGACASSGWFLALALSPAAPVRAVGVAEAPLAALAGRRLFREKLAPTQLIAGVGVIVGVVLTALN